MKIKQSFRICQALFVGVAMAFFSTARGQQNPVDQAAVGVNLAAVAQPSSSYVSGDTTLAALNDGYDPRNSRDSRRYGSYGNWNRRGTQWVQYDWSQTISTNKIEVYWWADGRDVNVPKACRLLYWNGKGDFFDGGRLCTEVDG